MNNKSISPIKNFYTHLGLRNWIYHKRALRRLGNFIKSIEDKKLLNKTIVINAVRSLEHNFNSEVFFGILFALNGAKVKVLMDDGIMMHWDTYEFDILPIKKNIDEFSLNPYFNPYYYKKISRKVLNGFFEQDIKKSCFKTYTHKNLEYIFYSQIIDKKNLNYENIEDLKYYAESSTIRFFKTTQLDYDDKNVKYYYLLSLKNALISREIGKYVLNEIKPDYFSTSHAIYSTYRPAFDYLEKNGIKCRVFGGAKCYTMDHRDVIYSDTKTQTLSTSKFWLKYKEKPVTQEMINKIEGFFKDRLNINGADMKWLKYMEKDKIFAVNKNDGYKYHICLFPNVIWDGNIKERHVIFKGVLDWLLSTIKYLKNRKDIKMYIKAHPGELTFSEKTDRIIDLIKHNINIKEFENLILIPPEKKINTYEFLKSGIDLGIVYDGILGIEIPLLKIPTIVIAKGGYISVENGDILVNNKQEYFNYLDNIDSVINEFHENYQKYYLNIVRYAYWFIFDSNIKLPTISNYKGHFIVDLMKVKKEELILDKYFLEIFE